MHPPDPARRSAAPLRIVIVEDDEALAGLLVEHLEGDSRFARPRTYSHARSGVSGVKEFHPHVVLVDLRLKGSSGFDCIRRIRAECPPTRVLAFTASADEESVFGALKAGAEGYLVKGLSLREVADALVAVCSGVSVISNAVLPKVIASFHRPEPAGPRTVLTPTEQAVMDFTIQGLDCKTIARHLGISVHTIYIHNKNIIRKLRVTNRHEAAALWRQRVTG
jgi:DNA-binding NarL/FixJ family response regulator